MREFFANILVIALGVAFLVHFGLIVRYGEFLIREPSLIILGLEIGLLLSCISFAIVNIAWLLRSKKKVE